MILNISISKILGLYELNFLSFIIAAVIFTILNQWPNLRCMYQPPWWANCSIRTDIFYVILNPVFKIILRFFPAAIILVLMSIFIKPMQIYAYLVNGSTPLGTLSPLSQCLVFVLLSDFLSYWFHRLLHKKYIWPVHAVHHGPHHVDWTTSYRFHPLNLVINPWLVTSIMILMGISPVNILLVSPLELFMAYFVHSNLNITLGPFKYLIATPVFHRWHHSYCESGVAMNFGAIFSLWDVLFGTIYLPEKILPNVYGIPDEKIDEGIFNQLIFPFYKWIQYIHKALRP